MCFLEEVIGEQVRSLKNEHSSDKWIDEEWRSSREEGMSKALEAVRIVACLGLGQSLAQWQEAQKAEMGSFSPWA